MNVRTYYRIVGGREGTPKRIGVCLDTCHMFAAGYAMAPEPAFEATIAELDNVVGLNRVKAAYVSDSAAKLGNRVGRHANIGRGLIGLEAFRLLVNAGPAASAANA